MTIRRRTHATIPIAMPITVVVCLDEDDDGGAVVGAGGGREDSRVGAMVGIGVGTG